MTPQTSEWSDPRFRELDRLIALGFGNIKPGRTFQTLNCVRCGDSFLKHIKSINLDQPQYCRYCLESVARHKGKAKQFNEATA